MASLESRIHPDLLREMRDDPWDDDVTKWRLKHRCTTKGDINENDYVEKDDDDEPAECDFFQIGVNIWNLKRQQLWPLHKLSKTKTFGTLLATIEGFEYEGFDRKKGVCLSCTVDFGAEVRNLVEEAQSWFPGLCLDCIKSGKHGDKRAGTCRLKHTEDFLSLRTGRGKQD